METQRATEDLSDLSHWSAMPIKHMTLCWGSCDFVAETWTASASDATTTVALLTPVLGSVSCRQNFDEMHFPNPLSALLFSEGALEEVVEGINGLADRGSLLAQWFNGEPAWAPSLGPCPRRHGHEWTSSARGSPFVPSHVAPWLARYKPVSPREACSNHGLMLGPVAQGSQHEAPAPLRGGSVGYDPTHFTLVLEGPSGTLQYSAYRIFLGVRKDLNASPWPTTPEAEAFA
ncbi:hypothetical protein S7711_11034 [Stachybotrys chartarum IBT 7711]|uniref:Uncharacterized protein n=1 Tax=Stachybotrys chartarum (strain CBS 109288 / IBT 7711) TaxID=1280523 RepID=A0A084AX34_STACB|nr:hypothetical protein S7711_11034 [Stachybotrys chartarum IBT 7711]KFA54853.1 hypothetical protein S40293_10429 [Stachybotrys chartarum IBT 40293]